LQHLLIGEQKNKNKHIFQSSLILLFSSFFNFGQFGFPLCPLECSWLELI